MGDSVYNFSVQFPEGGGALIGGPGGPGVVSDVGNDNLLSSEEGTISIGGLDLTYIGQSTVGGVLAPIFDDLNSTNVVALLTSAPAAVPVYIGLTTTDPFDFSAIATEAFEFGQFVDFDLVELSFEDTSPSLGLLTDSDGIISPSDTVDIIVGSTQTQLDYVGTVALEGVAYPVFLTSGTEGVVFLPASVDTSLLFGTEPPFAESSFNFDGSTPAPTLPAPFVPAFSIEILDFDTTPTYGNKEAVTTTIELTENDGSFDLDEIIEDGLTNYVYKGFVEVNSEIGLVFTLPGTGETFAYFETDPGTAPTGDAVVLTEASQAVCFAEGTRIATPAGERPVEALQRGDLILSADGRAIPVKWVGRQTLHRRFARPERTLVRVAAGALGGALPRRDLKVTADHGLLIDGMLVNAGALVNGGSVNYVSPSDATETYSVYHIETDDHDVILAEGAPAETYIDYVARRAFDNHAEYVALYGDEQTIAEMPAPRISAARLVPQALKDELRPKEQKQGNRRIAA